MTLNEALSTLGMSTDCPELWRDRWDHVQSMFETARIPALQQKFTSELHTKYGLASDITRVLDVAFNAVQLNEALSRMVWLWLHLAIYEGQNANGWPTPSNFHLFHAVIIASGFPHMEELHRSRHIDASVTSGNCRDLEIWMRHELRTKGEWGFQQFDWMVNHITGRLYRLGRLQFIYQPFHGPMYAYRNRSTGEILTMSASDVTYTRDGHVNGSNGQCDEMAWKATYEETDEAIKGYRIHPDGYVIPNQITISKSEWQLVLTNGYPTLDVHIPEDGKLLPIEYMASLKAAPEFYSIHFPESASPVAFTCGSWLLDYQYANILPESSNIVSFQKIFYKYPMLSDDDTHFWRVFGEKPGDIQSAPKDTTIRRAMVEFTLAGGRLRSAGGFIPIVR